MSTPLTKEYVLCEHLVPIIIFDLVITHCYIHILHTYYMFSNKKLFFPFFTALLLFALHSSYMATHLAIYDSSSQFLKDNYYSTQEHIIFGYRPHSHLLISFIIGICSLILFLRTPLGMLPVLATLTCDVWLQVAPLCAHSDPGILPVPCVVEHTLRIQLSSAMRSVDI